MKNFYLLVFILTLHVSITAQEIIDIALQLNTNNINTSIGDNSIGKKITTSSIFQKEAGHIVASKIISNSEIIWQLRIQVSGAKAIVPYFDELIIEDGAKIRAYSPKTKKSTQYFYHNDNILTKSFALPLVKGEDVVIEATFPDQASFAKFKLSISEVGALYSLSGFSEKAFGDAPACYANVNCSEGNPWADQIRSVAKYMITEGTTISYCTGSLINNTNQDCKNYFLSAQHCGMIATPTEFGQFVFYFNYEANSCADPANDNGLDQETVIGCTKIASSGSSISLPPDGSDFLLLELNAIPSSYNVYYSGWSRDDIPQIQGNGTVIQHPMGDLKKIAFWSTVGVSFSSSFHLEVVGVSSANGDGLVNPSSSGSPIFDGNKNIIGNVTAGSEGCVSDYATNNAFIVGGRFRNHWDQNGNTSILQLKPWLDPANTAVMSLNGKQQCSPVGINEEYLNNADFRIFPNPTSQFITIDANEIIEKINLYSLDGKLIVNTTKTNYIDVSKLPSGIIIVKIYFKNGEIAYDKVYKQ